MKTKIASTRLPVDVFERIESFASQKDLTFSSVLCELVCDHFQLEYTPEEFSAFVKVSKAMVMLSSKAEKTNAYYAEIGKELLGNLVTNDDGSYKRTKSGMYYFNDTEKLRDLITEYLEDEAEASEEYAGRSAP